MFCQGQDFDFLSKSEKSNICEMLKKSQFLTKIDENSTGDAKNVCFRSTRATCRASLSLADRQRGSIVEERTARASERAASWTQGDLL